MGDADRRRVHAFVSGRVQGVYFRGTTQEHAAPLGLDGWVRNLPDGRVEFVAEGPAGRVAQLLAWARRGPPRARVDDVEVHEEEPSAPTGRAPGFEVRY